MKEITITRFDELPKISLDFFDDILAGMPTYTLNETLLNQRFPHIPIVSAKLLISDDALQIKFHIVDKYIKSEVVEYNGPVCTDSCAELFFAVNKNGYFNIEINAGGTVHSSFIRDHERTADGFADFEYLALEDLQKIEVYTTMPRVVFPEITDKTVWELSYNVPLSVLKKYAGDFSRGVGDVWHGNLYKCADNTSRPHWLSYYPISEGFNFHQPKYFGKLIIE